MSKAGKQVMDIKTSKGLAQSSNEELRAWTDKGWEQAMREGNYDRSREHLNFEIQRGGIVTPIDKSRPLTRRMAENLASRGIKDPNEGLDEPRYRTVVNFIFGGSTERMRELAFGNQEVDFESKKGNEHIRRMPEIEEWAKDIYRFVADKYGEENIVVDGLVANDGIRRDVNEAHRLGCSDDRGDILIDGELLHLLIGLLSQRGEGCQSAYG